VELHIIQTYNIIEVTGVGDDVFCKEERPVS
jgi:hypothetical protein